MTTISPTESGHANQSIAATPGARYGCVSMAKIAKASAVSKPPLSPTVSAVISDFLDKLVEEKTADGDAHARLKKALLEDQSADAASLTIALFGVDEK
jgi:hypothetical protein